MNYRLGYFGARGDRRGLAIQATEFCRHLQPDKVFGIDMGMLSPYPNDWSDYDPASIEIFIHDQVTPALVSEWLSDLDVVFGAETFYYPGFTRLAQEQHVRTLLQFNPEFFAHVKADEWAPLPDRLVAPSTWMIDRTPDAVLMPVGVDRERLPFQLRKRVDSFLHIVGHSAAHDRQGTKSVFEALRFVKEPTKMIVRSQRPMSVPRNFPSHVEIDVRINDAPRYWELYEEGDVLVHPRRYGGLSLPMQEALSRGMPVLMPNAPPQDKVLSPEMLVPWYGGRRFRSLVGDIPLYDMDHMALAQRMDGLSANPDQVEQLSKQADQLATSLDWEVLASQYRLMFESVLRTQ